MAQSPELAQRLIKPNRLKKGDTIGLIAPGSALSTAKLHKCINQLENYGFKVKKGKYVGDEYGYLASEDKNRLDDLNAMYRDDEVDAIWCARGGYGCTRLLPNIDYDLIRHNPKALIGYSDITALHQAIYQYAGVVGYHGPVASSDFNDYTVEQWEEILVNPVDQLSPQNHEDHELKTLVKGMGAGVVMGGNLTLLASMCGTPYQCDFTDKVVFLEDIGEKPYRIDRMLTQLRQSCHLDQASAIVLGIFYDCEADPDDKSLSLEECLADRIVALGVPTLSGVSIGHIDHQLTVPVGIRAEVDADAQSFTFLEAAVS